MYNGDEKLINNGDYLPYSIKDFWRWSYSNLLHNMQRGAFAEFIVKSALSQNGVHENLTARVGTEPYDLDGPWIPAFKRPAHIEVKCAAFVQMWDIKHPDRASFGIAPAKLPDKNGDFNDAAPKQRNSDMYVFALYTATDRRRNILDLSWWEFYVCPTDILDDSPRFNSQKTISLNALREFCQPCTFNELYPRILEICNGFDECSKNRPAAYTSPEDIIYYIFSAIFQKAAPAILLQSSFYLYDLVHICN